MGRENESLIVASWSHDQDGKNPSKIFYSGTSRPISTKLGILDKTLFCICEKGADQLRGNVEADQRICFH